MDDFTKKLCERLEKCDLQVESNALGRFNFNFLMDIPESKCEDNNLQKLCDKIVKKLWELEEIRENYDDFEFFDRAFNMDLVGYGEEYELEEEYLDEDVFGYL